MNQAPFSSPLEREHVEKRESDPRLEKFLAARDEAAIRSTLGEVIARHVDPVFQRVLIRKLGASAVEQAEIEEVSSFAREQLIVRLLALHVDKNQGGHDFANQGDQGSIRDLEAYAATLAYSAWARYLSRRRPRYALLANRLRYLFDHEQGPRPFAAWRDASGERWCGFARWQETWLRSRQTSGAGTPESRRSWFTQDPVAAARSAVALAGGPDPATGDLASLLSAIFRWIDGPVEWHELLSALARIQGADQATEAADEAATGAAAEVPDPSASPSDHARWHEYLGWLWRAVGELPLRQRRAFVLHSETVFEWEAAGFASVRGVARLLDLPPEELASFWRGLPLDDLTIAEMLGATRQQVINLRRVARDSLGRAWRIWSADHAAPASANKTHR